MPKTPSDIHTAALPPLAWEPPQCVDSLQALVNHGSARAEEAVNWYLKAKRGKRRGARLLRMATILLTTAAGILPILQQIWTTSDGKPPFAPAWASVLLALAVLLVAIDRFFGFSDAWMRYVTAELQIRQVREAFELDWQAAHASFGGQPPTPVQVQAVISNVKAFVDQVNALVATETTKWVSDFQEALRQIDEGAKRTAQAAQTGSLLATVENGDQVDQPGWMLVVDESQPVPYTGKTAAMVGLSAGDHVVRVSGRLNNQLVRAEAVATIKGGATTPVHLTLA
jgi:hypothetical protein